MATNKSSILDCIEEKGKTALLVTFSESNKIHTTGEHQTDEQTLKVSVLATVNKFRAVGIKALTSW